MKTLEKDLSQLPAKLRKAVDINVKLLDKADFTSEDIDVYLDYLTKKILFIDYSEKKDGGVDLKALAYDMDSYKFFEGHVHDTFKSVCEYITGINGHLTYDIQVAPDYAKEHINTIRNILYKYRDFLRSEFVATKAQEQLEENMSSSLDPILKKSHYAQNNLLTKSGFSDNLTVVQKKVLNYFILKFQNQKQVDLFGNSYFNVTTQELVSCGCGSNVSAIMKSLKDLMENTSMYIQFGDKWTMYNIFASFQGAVNNNCITVRFTPEMSALINKIGVSRNYTLLSFNSMNSIKKYASMRMYELCCQFRNMDADHVSISDEQLRMMLNCRDKYLNPKDFKKWVLKVAEKELTQLAQEGKVDLYFTFAESRKEKADWEYNRKRVLEWSFVIHRAYSYKDGFITHDSKADQEKNALKTIADLLFKYEDISQQEKMGYSRFCKSLSTERLVALVQDLQFEIMFSSDKSKEAVNAVFEKHGFREGGE